MADNVTPIDPRWAPPQPAVNKNVIKFLEETLEAARAGEIVGIAGATVHPGHCTTPFWVGKSGRGTMGCLQVVLYNLAKIDTEE